LIVEGIARTTLGRATRIVNANFQKAPGCTNITTKPYWMTCLRRAQLFSHGLARRAKDRDRRGFETARIDRLEISWPTSGVLQTFRNVRADQAIRIVENEASYAPLALKRIELAK